MLDPRWSRARAAGGDRGRAARPPDRARRQARQVPDRLARGRRPPRHAPAHDRQPAARRAGRRGARRTCAWRSSSTTADRLLFVDVRRFGTGDVLLGGDALARLLRLAARRGAARAPTSPPRRCAPWRAAASSRSRRSCSTRSGSPAWATSTPTRRCSGRRSIRCARSARSSARRSRRCATAWSSRSSSGIDSKGASIDDYRHVDGAARQLPGPLPRPLARGRAVRRAAARRSRSCAPPAAAPTSARTASAARASGRSAARS